MGFILDSYRFSSGALSFDDVDVIYTLRLPNMTTSWTNAVLRLRRTSDNALSYVFFDSGGKLSLTSLISTSSTTTPSATTLATWVGANSAYCHTLYGVTPDNIIDTDKLVTQSTTTTQPQFISSGTIITKNSEPTLNFLTDTRYLQGNANTTLDSGNSYTIFTVTSSDSNSVASAFFVNSTSGGDRLVIYNDRRTQKRIAQLRASSTNYFADYLAQQDTANQKLLTVINDSSNIDSYYNNTIQTTTAWSSSYGNNDIVIGADSSGANPLNGNFQELIIYASDKTSELEIIHTDINNYYSIY